MATNLEFINQTTASSVSSLDITDVFTAKYDHYQVDDSLANDSKYDICSWDLKSDNSFAKYSFVNQDGGVGWRGIGGYVDDGDGYGITLNIFNPFANDKYTFGLAQSGSISASKLFGTKAMGVYNSVQSLGGYRVICSGSPTLNYVVATTYGVL